MYTPEEFKHHWSLVSSKELITYTYEETANTPLQKSTKDFLAIAGLPESASPFLSFNQKIYHNDLINLKDHLELIGNSFVNYYTIGGADNVEICVDTNHEDRIVMLDIDYIWEVDSGELPIYPEEECPIRFMNSSISRLAECLCGFQRFLGNKEVSRSRVEYLQAALEEIDPPCIEEKAFWWWETQYDAIFS